MDIGMVVLVVVAGALLAGALILGIFGAIAYKQFNDATADSGTVGLVGPPGPPGPGALLQYLTVKANFPFARSVTANWPEDLTKVESLTANISKLPQEYSMVASTTATQATVKIASLEQSLIEQFVVGQVSELSMANGKAYMTYVAPEAGNPRPYIVRFDSDTKQIDSRQRISTNNSTGSISNVIGINGSLGVANERTGVGIDYSNFDPVTGVWTQSTSSGLPNNIAIVTANPVAAGPVLVNAQSFPALAWVSSTGEIKFSRSSDAAGSAWPAGTTVATVAGTNSIRLFMINNLPAIMVGTGGADTNIKLFKSATISGGLVGDWTATLIAANGQAQSIDAVQDGANIHVIARKALELTFWTSSDNGTTFGTPVIVSSTLGASPILCVRMAKVNDRLYVVTGSKDGFLVARSVNLTGATWDTPANLLAFGFPALPSDGLGLLFDGDVLRFTYPSVDGDNRILCRFLGDVDVTLVAQ